MPKGDKRTSRISIDRSASYFRLTTNKLGKSIGQIMLRDSCILKVDGINITSENDRASHNLSCKQAKKMKDYYTYLYGLPMKLKDPGTIVLLFVETILLRTKNIFY